MLKKIYNFIRFKKKYLSKCKYAYKVKSKDTIKTIAKEFDVDEWAIVYLNRNNPNCGSLVFPYKVLWIPLRKPSR